MKHVIDDEVLHHFRESVLQYFGQLMRDHSFVVYEANIHRPDVWMKLRNGTTQIMIDYEWGVGCWVTIGRLTRWLKRIPEEYALKDVLRAVDPEAPFPDVSCHDYDFECVETAVGRLGEITSIAAVDLLRGDFRVRTKIAQLRSRGARVGP